MPIGILYAASAYTAWGLFPLFFKQIASVDAVEVVMHRTVWSMVFVVLVLSLRRHWGWLSAALRSPRVLATFAASATLLACNWVVYVWAVANDHVLDASLGYFILPLVNVAMGYAVLRERPRRGQWFAVGVAACGVLWLTWQGGRMPWVALVLALTFGVYGLVRKLAPLAALEGLTLETLLLAPFAAGVLLYWAEHGQGVLATPVSPLWGWLLLAGPITAIPLWLFAAGARRVPLSTMGVLQYISPSLQLLLGVALYGEPFGGARVLGFCLIWLALAIYSLEGWWWSRAQLAATDISATGK
ncbi:EamA family transporter RarD [Curvibacter sp. APW13]|uniref:EamA family transporter RarD n=1 Tax=Curvibacter sp. APW13 TaxID=3077236 RepID=UPI0028DEF9AB|nr:EamA family transporter RarD [Curvibacter sp. APW13]MDT8990164.1 EamA family transporter RarD [Curvibacter sp. APW13]